MSLTGSSAGDWFHRLGLFEAFFLDAASLFGGTTTSNVGSAAQVPTRLASLTTDLLAGTADYVAAAATEEALASFQSSGLSSLSLQNVVQQLLIKMADTIVGLSTLDEASAVTALINKMTAASATINHGTVPAVGAQTALTGVTPVGNPVFVWSVVDGAGRALQYCYAETATATITQDAQGDANLLGSEPWQLVGENSVGDHFAYNWLASGYGSGATLGGQLVDPAVDNEASTGSPGGGQLLANGTFATFTTTNQADNWTYAVGVATTNFLDSHGTTVYYTGEGSIKLLSDGSTLNSMTQAFNTASATGAGLGGTPYALVPSAINNTQYTVFLALKLTNASPTDGTLTVDLIDGGGTVIADDASANNTFAIDLTAIGDTNWHTYSGTFRMPKTLPTSTPYKLRIHFTSTVLDSGKGVYLGAVAVAIPNQFYVGGPYVTAFRGSTAVNASSTAPDAWTFGITYTPGKLQKAMWRWFDMPNLAPQVPGLMIPAVTSGSATIADSLVA